MNRKERRKTQRKAVYCVNCEMWFDTHKGWQAKKAEGPIPLPMPVLWSGFNGIRL